MAFERRQHEIDEIDVVDATVEHDDDHDRAAVADPGAERSTRRALTRAGVLAAVGVGVGASASIASPAAAAGVRDLDVDRVLRSPRSRTRATLNAIVDRSLQRVNGRVSEMERRLRRVETQRPASTASQVLVVRHGRNSAAARPRAEVVLWYGSVTPRNAAAGDIFTLVAD